MENLVHSLAVIDSLKRLNELIEMTTEKARKPGPAQLRYVNTLIRLSESRARMLKQTDSNIIRLYGWLLLNQPASLEDISNSNVLPGFTAYHNALKLLTRANLIRKDYNRNYAVVVDVDVEAIEQFGS
ncbi:MAG: hypothetical protein ACYDBT_09730 [Desulfobulbaceae bacterium]